MQGFVRNKYVQAAGIAFATGLLAALGAYLATMTDGLDMRHTIKLVGESFLVPFATLVSVLPKITDVLTPTVRIVGASGVAVESVEQLAELATPGILTTEPETNVRVVKTRITPVAH